MCAEVGARAFLAPSRLRGRSKSKKKSAEAQRKKKREKRESNESGKNRIFTFSSLCRNTGNPVPEPKATRQEV
jgi:hypothetical protein